MLSVVVDLQYQFLDYCFLVRGLMFITFNPPVFE